MTTHNLLKLGYINLQKFKYFIIIMAFIWVLFIVATAFRYYLHWDEIPIHRTIIGMSVAIIGFPAVFYLIMRNTIKYPVFEITSNELLINTGQWKRRKYQLSKIRDPKLHKYKLISFKYKKLRRYYFARLLKKQEIDMFVNELKIIANKSLNTDSLPLAGEP